MATKEQIKKWFLVTLKTAQKDGLKRGIYQDALLEEYYQQWCKDYYDEDDKNQISTMIYEDLMGFEKICELIDCAQVLESTLHKAEKYIMW